MNLEFEQRSCLIDGVYFCPFHEEAVIPEFKKKSNFRKPNPGMLIKASLEHSIDLGTSIIMLSDETATSHLFLNTLDWLNNFLRK